MVIQNSTNKTGLSDKFREKSAVRATASEWGGEDPLDPCVEAPEFRGLPDRSDWNTDMIQVPEIQLSTRTRELADANIALQLANRELQAINFTVSHDLRTPLSTVSMCAQAVLRHCGNNLDEQCHSYLQSVVDQSEYMNRLLNSLLDFSRASCKEIEKSRVDISCIAEKIAVNLKLNSPERTAVFNIAQKIEVSGDQCLLQEVMENLIGNAWKYTCMRELAIIEFGVTEHDGKTAYYVRDNGIGFEQEQADRMFGIFERCHCKDQFKGYGVGLAAVKRIILRHGGEIWAEGETGKGATFYFTL